MNYVVRVTGGPNLWTCSYVIGLKGLTLYGWVMTSCVWYSTESRNHHKCTPLVYPISKTWIWIWSFCM